MKFKLSEKEVLPEVKEVDETVDSQASSKIEDILVQQDSQERSEKLEKL